MNGSRIEVDEFETRLRAELHRRADGLVLGHSQARFEDRRRTRRHSMTAVAVAGALIATAIVVAALVGRDGSGSHVRTRVPTTEPSGQRSFEHFTIRSPGVRLRTARDLPATTGSPNATFATATYRKPGALEAPIVYATLDQAKHQVLPSSPEHHPRYQRLDVAGHRGEIVWLGRDLADFVVQVDAGRTLDLRAWGLTKTELVAAASRVVMNSDGSFDLPALPASLAVSGADALLTGNGARAEYSIRGGSIVLTAYADGLESALGTLLYPGSGTRLGTTTIERISVDGAAGLLRVDRSEAGTRLGFHALWEPQPNETAELAGGATTKTDVANMLDAITPVGDQAWHEIVTRSDRGEDEP